jgi:hypothetical protein
MLAGDSLIYVIFPFNIAYFSRLSGSLPPDTRCGEPKPRYLQYLDRSLLTTTTEQDSPRHSICFVLPSVARGPIMVCNPPALFQFGGLAGAAVLCEALHRGPRDGYHALSSSCP